MNWKKALSLLLAGSMSLSLVACGGGDKKPEEKPETGALKGSITVQAEEGWKPYYEAAIERVKKANPDVEISIIEKGAFDHIEVIDKTGPKNEDVADVFSIPADRLYGMVEGENLAAIDAEGLCTTVGGWKDFAEFNQGLGGNFKIGDEYFAFPMNIECLLAFKQKANATAQNVDLTKPVEIGEATWAQVQVPAFDAWYGVALLNSAGIELLEKKEDGSFASDLTMEWSQLPKEKQAVIEALYGYWKGNADNNTSLFDDKAGYAYTDTQFETGKNGVIRLGGPWDYNTIAKAAGEENLELGALDNLTIAGKPLTHWKGGWGYAINVRNEEDTNKMAICKALIAELANPEFFEEYFKATGKVMEQVSADKYQASGLTDVEKATVVNMINSYQNAVSRPLFQEYGQVWDTWKNAVLSWNAEKPSSAEEAYKQLKASFDAMMTNLQK
ncbi:sugar ABC transporter substrate-binding protein [uncultured Murdochiella sp.]|uniref:sugar ABC transporter substrate-binding protein n=1 Tax=uncultured Murdochiella sp. TaxID=1586095 RepID=UPI0028045452|nr:sugar ABC transporter substrate-binding protein [uncultured Murdochiella sp.]